MTVDPGRAYKKGTAFLIPLYDLSEDKPPFQKTYYAKKVVLCVWSSVQRKRPFFPDFHAPVTAKGCQNKLPAFPGLLPAQVIRAASSTRSCL